MPAIQPLFNANVRSQSYLVVRTNIQCWNCNSLTCVLTLALPRNHETLDPDVADAWHRANADALIFFVEGLTEEVRSRLEGISRHYKLGYCGATQNSYWANHCEQCGELLGDHELHCELDGAFMPSSVDVGSRIQLLRLEEPIEAAAAGYSLDPEFFDFTRRV